MYEPSATEPVEVILEVGTKELKETTIIVELGGPGAEIIDILKGNVDKERQVYTFIVPPGKKWGVQANAEIEVLYSLYLPLG
jgi:hypothetical protein